MVLFPNGSIMINEESNKKCNVVSHVLDNIGFLMKGKAWQSKIRFVIPLCSSTCLYLSCAGQAALGDPTGLQGK